jgi:hypothetical protein
MPQPTYLVSFLISSSEAGIVAASYRFLLIDARSPWPVASGRPCPRAIKILDAIFHRAGIHTAFIFS